jgi:hypothetical protein
VAKSSGLHAVDDDTVGVTLLLLSLLFPHCVNMNESL